MDEDRFILEVQNYILFNATHPLCKRKVKPEVANYSAAGPTSPHWDSEL